MKLDVHQLRRYEPSASAWASQPEGPSRPPIDTDLVLFGAGNSGEAAALRIQALFYNDGVYVPAFGLNNDLLAPRPLVVRAPAGSAMSLELTERLVLGESNARSRIGAYPLLERRYHDLLRGIPVFETYPRAGHGGHGHPVISALDMDLNIDELVAFLRRTLRQLHPEVVVTPGRGNIQHLIESHHRRREAKREQRILVHGGGTGSMGNAAHCVLPYLIRHVLAELGITGYELWGVIVGPHAFTGLTPFVTSNYHALLQSIDYLARHGQRRRYINDLMIDMQVPPYDRIFLLDDPHLPGNGVAVTEAELDVFLDQAALSVYLLLRGTVWETVAAHTANPDQRMLQRTDLDQPRYLHTVQGVLASVDHAQLTELLAARLEMRALEALTQRLNG
jgi:hypothetical protein